MVEKEVSVKEEKNQKSDFVLYYEGLVSGKIEPKLEFL